MSAGRGGSAAGAMAPPGDLLGRARAALGSDDPARLAQLCPDLERLQAAIAGMPTEAVVAEWRSLLALLDAAEGLTAALQVARAQVLDALRDAGARHRAGAAYRRAGRLGSRDGP